jgi:hypothetical protein
VLPPGSLSVILVQIRGLMAELKTGNVKMIIMVSALQTSMIAV